MQKKLITLCAVIVVGIGTAITYSLFERAVHGFINLVWYDTFNTDTYRLAVVPLAMVFSLIFFGLQHYLDRKSEGADEHGLGNMPSPTIVNFVKVLVIGFFSLVAGAALGPEAILVPACMILGGYVGTRLFKGEKQLVGLLAAAGLMALFTAFFNSFFVGVLSLWLVLTKSNAKFKPVMLVVAVVASFSSIVTLNLIGSEAYAKLPVYGWAINPETILISFLLLAAGFVAVVVMSAINNGLAGIRKRIQTQNWVVWALVASLVLATLMLIGGPLVEFTGNKSIAPMFEQANSLGLVGLLWILGIKIIAISWSKTIGYRGGMIFPTIFIAAVLVAIVQLYVSEFNLIYGIIAVIIGAFIANKKSHVLV